jgi:hypothetical protein
VKDWWGREVEIDVPDEIIAHLTRECDGNVPDHHVVNITCGSFEKETQGANPHSTACENNPKYAANNATDLEAVSRFVSACRYKRCGKRVEKAHRYPNRLSMWFQMSNR